MMTAAQIVADACAICKAPGFTMQGGRALNLALNDLVFHRDMKINRVSSTINIGIGNNGPFNLEADYLRTYDMFYLINGQPFFLSPASQERYDSRIKTGIKGYPNEYTTDLSPQATDQVGLLYIYPQSNSSITITHRYMLDQADITTPETSTTIPWMKDQDYLVTATAMRLMRITDDSRYERFEADAEILLKKHLIMEGDEQKIVKEVRLDTVRFKTKGNFRADKLTGF